MPTELDNLPVIEYKDRLSNKNILRLFMPQSKEGENPMTDTLTNLTPEELLLLPKDENGNPILPTEVTITQSPDDISG